MKELDMIRIEDMKDEPSRELNERTLAAMRAAEEKKTRKKVPAWRKFAVCAALFCSALVLMGAGVKVFEYLTYVPGMGVVTADQAEVYTLERVVEAGNYRIEAASMIPAEDEEHKGMWQVTVLTDMEVTDSEPDETIRMISEDGNELTLVHDGDSDLGTVYSGYTETANDGSYILQTNEGEYALNMKNLENTAYAHYQYPVNSGLTVVAFPLAEGSERLIFDVLPDPNDENMMFWFEHSTGVIIQALDLKVTDTQGNTYEQSGYRSQFIGMKLDMEKILSFDTETYLILDRKLEAPIASISMEGIRIIFEGLNGLGKYAVTIPKYGETIMANAMPEHGVFINTHGIRAAFDSINGRFNEKRNSYEVYFTGDDAVCEFAPEDSYTSIGLRYMSSSGDWKDGESLKEENGKLGYHCLIEGNGDAEPKMQPLSADFGDTITVVPYTLYLTIDGSWIIDFTAPANTAE